MTLARIIRQSALTLGLVFTFIGMGQAATQVARWLSLATTHT